MAFETTLAVKVDPSGAISGARRAQSAIMSMGRVGSSAFQRLRSSVFSLQSAFALLGVGLVAKSFLNAASETENLTVRLKALTGSAQNAAEALKIVTEFASTVAFTFQDIQAASGVLITVSDDMNQFKEILKLTGDIAAVTGLSFQETAGQIQRSFSAGINSADLFRERGVKAMLGFQAGVEVSAEETKKKIISTWRDSTSSIVGAAQDLSTTWTGITSMLEDSWFRFKVSVMDSGVFDFAKASVEVLRRAVNESFGTFEKMGASAGDAIVEFVIKASLGVAHALDNMRGLFRTLGDGVNKIIALYNSLPAVLQEVGIVGALLMPKKALALVILGLGLLEKVPGLMDQIRSNLADIEATIGPLFKGEAIPMLATDMGAFESATSRAAEEIQKLMATMQRSKSVGFEDAELGNTFKGLAKVGSALTEVEKSAEKARLSMVAFGDSVRDEVSTDVEKYEKRILKLRDAFNKGAIGQETFDRAVKKAQETLVESNETFQLAIRASENFSTSLIDGFQEGKSVVESFKAALLGLVDELIKSLAKLAINETFQALFGVGAGVSTSGSGNVFGGGGGGGGLLGSLLGGAGNGLLGGLFGGGGGGTLADVGTSGTAFTNFDGGIGSAGGGEFGSFGGFDIGSAFGNAGFSPSFATGGSFKVGGTGSTDSKRIAFNASPGELVNIRTPGQANNMGTGGTGGDTYITIDARGSNGDAAVEAAVQRGIRRAAPQLINASVNAVKTNRQRDPGFFGRTVG